MGVGRAPRAWWLHFTTPRSFHKNAQGDYHCPVTFKVRRGRCGFCMISGANGVCFCMAFLYLINSRSPRTPWEENQKRVENVKLQICLLFDAPNFDYTCLPLYVLLFVVSKMQYHTIRMKVMLLDSSHWSLFRILNLCLLVLWMYMGVSLNGGTPKTPQNDHF